MAEANAFRHYLRNYGREIRLRGLAVALHPLQRAKNAKHAKHAKHAKKVPVSMGELTAD